MKISAGASASICFAKVLLAPYETTSLLPVLASNCLAWSSIASLRLAAAKTVTSAAMTTGDATVRYVARANDANAPSRQRILSSNASIGDVIYSRIFPRHKYAEQGQAIGAKWLYKSLYFCKYYVCSFTLSCDCISQAQAPLEARTTKSPLLDCEVAAWIRLK